MHPMIWAVLLMALGLSFAALEIFIPSAGILGFLSVASIIGSVFLAFSYGLYSSALPQSACQW